MTGNNNIYETIWKNGNKEYNEKHICCFFTIWNLKSALTYKCGGVVLFILPLADSYCLYSFQVPFLFNRSQSKASVANQMSHLFFWGSNVFFVFFYSLQLFENYNIHNVVSTWNNIVKVDVENNNIVST